jgi:hypothetical protein
VIKFKCIYCGQKILAKDDGAGEKGKCPKCAHLLTVPESTKGRPAISFNKEPMPDRPAPPHVPESKRQATELPERINKMSEAQAEALAELFKESFGFLVPTYDKLSLVLAVIVLLLLYFGNGPMREQILGLTQRNWQGKTSQGNELWSIFYLAFIMFFVFLVIRVFQFGTERDFIKKIMLIFAILTNTIIGIIAGIYIIRNTVTSDWLLVFPVWNIINCVLLLFILFFNLINEDCISDREVTLFRFCLGLTAIVAIFLLCNYTFKLYWAVTFSICTVYTTSFDRALQNVFPGLTGQKYEQAEE